MFEIIDDGLIAVDTIRTIHGQWPGYTTGTPQYNLSPGNSMPSNIVIKKLKHWHMGYYGCDRTSFLGYSVHDLAGLV